jgi:hypothetical protein
LWGKVEQTFAEKAGEGYEVSPGIRTGLHARAFVTLDHAEQHLSGGWASFTARTSASDSRIALSSAVAVANLTAQMRAAYLAFAKREDALKTDIEAARAAGDSSAVRTALDAVEAAMLTGW